MAPQVSVIIPTYNCDRYIAQAIDSVLIQTNADFEVIVIDDGSTDHTREILQPYHDQIRYIHQSNQGVAAARNLGIEQSKGDLIAFLDADDYFLPGKLSAQRAIFEANSSLGIVHSGWQRVTAQGSFLMTVEPWHSIPILDLESWLRWKPVLPSAMMFQREALVRSGGFDRRFPPAEDTELVLRLALMGYEAAWLPQVTVCYRQHETSAMSQGLPQARSLSAVIDHFFAQPNLPEPIRLMEQRVRYSTLSWIGWYLYQTGHPIEMVSYLKQAWRYCPYSVGEAIVQWAENFAQFSNNIGVEFDAHALGKSAEWQEFMRWLLAQA